MVSELQKNQPAEQKDKAPTKPEAAEHQQPAKLQQETQGAEALAHQRALRDAAPKTAAVLPKVELVDKPIKSDGSSQTYHVKDGDTLSEIARRHLPQGTSVRDVYKHVAEIARANGISDADKIQAGADLKLPERKTREAGATPASEAKPGQDAPAKPAQDAPAKPAQDAPAKPAQDAPAKPAQDAPAKPVQDAPAKPAQDAPAKPVQEVSAKPGEAVQPGQEIAERPQPALAPVDRPAMEKAAAAVERALGPDVDPTPVVMSEGYVPQGPITDRDKIMKVLGDKTPEEIKAISEIYQQKYSQDHSGRSLEEILKDRLAGHQRDQAVDLFHRGNKADDSGRVHTALQEMHDWGGRSQANCEKDIRDTLSTLNRSQIAQLDKDYQQRYGTSFLDAINKDDKVSAETKSAVAIYARGAENRTAQDTLALADLATRAKNIDMFQEAFRDASSEARKQYMDQGGAAKIREAFSGTFSNSDVVHALDYVKNGKLDTITKIKDNIGVFTNNNAAIDDAVKGMTDAERQAYMRGKAVADSFSEMVGGGRGGAHFNSEAFGKLTPEQKADYSAYKHLHDTLKQAGDESKVTRWEDLIAHKEETLAGKLTAHGGWVNDKFDKVLSDLEGMGKQDFDRLKADPSYRKQVEQAIAANYSKDELAQARQLLDRKLGVDSFEQSQNQPNRSVVDAVRDKDGFWRTDSAGILDSLQKMTAEEQKRYRDDPAFKKELDDTVRSAIGGRMEQFSADRILDRVSKGLSPKEDIVGKVLVHSKEIFPDHKVIIGEIETAIKEDPTLAERLRNPKNEADKEASRQFQYFSRSVLGGDYDRYVKPLLEKGSLPFAEKAQMYNGWFSNDTRGLYDAIKAASPEERAAIVADPKKDLSFLSDSERQLAVNIARQNGEMRPEDQMRAAILGMSGDKQTIKDLGQNLTAEQRAQLSRGYEEKYGTNLMADLVDKLGGQDRVEAARNFKALPESTRESFNNARAEEYVSNDGIGRSFVRNTWDGTSDQSRDNLNKYAASMSQYASVYREMPAEQSAKMAADLTSAVDLYRKSKGAAADAVVDGSIIAAGVGGAAFTGGVSLGLIATTGLAGAAFKVGTKAAVMGADYDSSGRQLVSDAASGAIDAATIVVGPAQIAKMFKIGEAASVAAGGAVIAESARLAEASGKQILKAGAEQTLARDLSHEVSTALAHGAGKIDDKVIESLAGKYAASEAERAQVAVMITEALKTAISKESSSALKNTLREVALNSGAGAAAGGSSGVVRGAADWDGSKSVDENLAAIGEQGLGGALSGAVMGGGATVGFKALGKGFSAVRETVAEHMHMPGKIGDSLPTGGGLSEGAVASAQHNVKLDGSGRVKEIHGADTTKVEYFKKGDQEGQPLKITLGDGTRYENIGDNKWRVSGGKDPVGVEFQGEIKVKTSGEIEIKTADGFSRSRFPDGTVASKDSRTGVTQLRDADGVLLGVQSRSGEVANYRYDADGKLNGVQFGNGRSLVSEDGGKTWSMSEPGAGEARKIEGSVRLGGDGSVRVKPSEGQGAEMVYRVDGSHSQIDPVSGRPSETVRPNGTHEKYEYRADGSLQKLTYGDGKYMVNVSTDSRSAYFKTISADGKKEVGSSAPVTVEKDGTVVFKHGGVEERFHTDGSRQVRELDTDYLLVDDVPASYRNKVRDVDGRPLAGTVERHDYVGRNFEKLDGFDEPAALKQVQRELRDVKAVGPDGKPTSAYESLIQDPTLSAAQKENVLRNLSLIREHFAGYREGDRMHPDPEVNWIHTQGEMAKVLEAARAKKLSATETEDALLASMYSDAVKFAFPPPKGVQANFFTHHLDGAIAANDVLVRQGMAPERVARIVEAIKAHQIAPPEFMGNLYHFRISSGLEAAVKDGRFSPEEAEHLRGVLKDMTVVGADGKSRIRAIADLEHAPKVIGEDGHLRIDFTEDQRKLMALSGTDTWTLPYDPRLDPEFKQLSSAGREEAMARRRIAQTLIDGDGIDNYATTGGASKIVAIRGPETVYPDHRVWESVNSIDASYRDAYSVMSPEARKIADNNYALRHQITDPEKGPIKSEMDAWLRSLGRDPDREKIPFYNADLKYPPKAENSAAVAEFSGQDARDYEFAKQIRSKMVELLRRDHRTDGSLPGNFESMRDRDPFSSKFPADAMKPTQLELPGTRLEDIKAGESWRSPDGTLSAFRKADDQSLLVSDFAANTSRQFDSNNRLTQLSGEHSSADYHYDQKGELDKVYFRNKATGETTELLRTESGWRESHADANGEVHVSEINKARVQVDADGTVKVLRRGEGRDEYIDRFNPDGSRDLLKPTGRIEYVRASHDAERVKLESAFISQLGADSPRLNRVQDLMQQFEKAADSPDRGLTENQRALLYKQLNRLLSPAADSAIPLADRVNLAEQALDHAAHPWSVDQGGNNTCNVTVLEHRNYWRNPDKNVQLLADIALTGKTRFGSGREVELHNISGELKPDFEAKRNLLRQSEGRDLGLNSLKGDGERDYSSQLLETAMVNQYWANKVETVDAGGRILDHRDLAMHFDADGTARGIVDHRLIATLHDAQGNKVSEFKPGTQYYNADKSPIASVPENRVIYDRNGRPDGFLPAGVELKRVFDIDGKEIVDDVSTFTASGRYFDEKGNLLIATTRPGDLHYEKVAVGPDKDVERVIVQLDGKNVELRKNNGDVVDSPRLLTTELSRIYTEVSADFDRPFIVAEGRYGDHGAVLGATDKQHFVDILKDLKDNNNLPAVLQVDVTHPPFNQPPKFDELGNPKNWHVINIHDVSREVDPATGEVKDIVRFTNQWGSEHDYLTKGIDAQVLFDSTKPGPSRPPDPPKPPKAIIAEMKKRTVWQTIKSWFTSSGS